MEILEPNSPDEFKCYFKKRWEILRKDLGFPEGSEIDDFENLSFHAMAMEMSQIIGVGRLTYFSSGEGQLRFMGVDEKFRNKKIGAKILVFLEEKARNMGLIKLYLNARIEARKFYIDNGYKQVGEVFKGFADIDHYKMIKEL